MSKNNPQAELKTKNENQKVKNNMRFVVLALLLFTFVFASACRYDMQDQPRYKYYKKSDFFADGRASRDLPEGAVPRGDLREDQAFYTGKIGNPDPNVQVQTTTDASGNTLVSSFPNDVAKMPVTVTKELIDRGQERYNIYCIVCHGPVGNGDGMIVRRGYPQPPTYHDDRLRNAPDGHFFDVITNGWGKMNSYAHQVPVADRWAIVAYIRALQVGQNPNASATMSANTLSNTANRTTSPASANAAVNTNAATNANTSGGAR